MINTDILSSTVSKLSQIIVQILDENGYFALLSPNCSFRLAGKLVVDFLFVLIELFSLGVVAEVLYRRILIGNRRF